MNRHFETPHESDAARRNAAEVRLLEQRKREALEQLREVAALVQGVLPETEREESMIGALRPERRGATTTGS
jgi:hypothetical protein